MNHRLHVVTLGLASALFLFISFANYAADEDCKNPLDPKFKSEQQKLTNEWLDIHKKLGKGASEPLTEADYLKIFAEGDPQHPAYQKTKAEWQKMIKAMGVMEGTAISQEQWQDTTNPLHPCHKFAR
jgi:hypothetical protein